MQQLRVILSGGGTGGHIFPAIAIANQIKKQIPDAEILFVGAKGRMEMEKVPALGYKIVGLWISGLQRRLTLSNLLFPFKVISSIIKSRKILNQFRPDVVIGTGGYASGPMLSAASAKGIPTLIQEQNSYPGITNKILSKKVDKICVAYDGLEKFFPASKIILTGNPVRQDIENIQNKREEAIKFFQLNGSKKTLLVIGGSLGARTINEAIGKELARLAECNIQVIWQTGKTYAETSKIQSKAFEKNNIRAYDFISRMDLAYAAADIVVSRAGASSISELCIVQKPCILVPSPNVAEDHQTKNAMSLVNKKAALLVKDIDASSQLVNEIIRLNNETSLQNDLVQNISKLSLLNSAEVIANEVLKLVNYKGN